MIRQTSRPLGLFLTLVLTSGLALAGPAGPAHAGTTTSGDVIFTASGGSAHRTQCTSNGHYTVGFSPEADYYDWSADVTIKKPSGAVYSTTTLSSSDWLGQFGTWCASRDQAGVYQVDVAFTGVNPSYEVIAEKTLHTTMTFTVEPNVQTGLRTSRSKLGKHKWLLACQVLSDGTPWAGRAVSFQVLSRGAWHDVTSARANGRGLVGFAVKPKRSFAKLKFRLHAAGGGYVTGASSRAYKLPVR